MKVPNLITFSVSLRLKQPNTNQTLLSSSLSIWIMPPHQAQCKSLFFWKPSWMMSASILLFLIALSTWTTQGEQRYTLSCFPPIRLWGPQFLAEAHCVYNSFLTLKWLKQCWRQWHREVSVTHTHTQKKKCSTKKYSIWFAMGGLGFKSQLYHLLAVLSLLWGHQYILWYSRKWFTSCQLPKVIGWYNLLLSIISLTSRGVSYYLFFFRAKKVRAQNRHWNHKNTGKEGLRNNSNWGLWVAHTAGTSPV